MHRSVQQPGHRSNLNVHPQHACVLNRFSHVWLYVTLWTVAHQAPLSTEILQARILGWVAMPSSRGSSRPRDRTRVSSISCITDGFFTLWATWEANQPRRCISPQSHFKHSSHCTAWVPDACHIFVEALPCLQPPLLPLSLVPSSLCTQLASHPLLKFLCLPVFQQHRYDHRVII